MKMKTKGPKKRYSEERDRMINLAEVVTYEEYQDMVNRYEGLLNRVQELEREMKTVGERVGITRHSGIKPVPKGWPLIKEGVKNERL